MLSNTTLHFKVCYMLHFKTSYTVTRDAKARGKCSTEWGVGTEQGTLALKQPGTGNISPKSSRSGEYSVKQRMNYTSIHAS